MGKMNSIKLPLVSKESKEDKTVKLTLHAHTIPVESSCLRVWWATKDYYYSIVICFLLDQTKVMNKWSFARIVQYHNLPLQMDWILAAYHRLKAVAIHIEQASSKYEPASTLKLNV